MSPHERMVADFVRGLERKKLPIVPNDAYLFGHALLERNPPAGWLNRLVNTAQYIDKPTFDRNLVTLAEVATDTLKDREYAVSLTDQQKSDYWIYQNLLQLGVPEATQLFDWEKEEKLTEKSWNPWSDWIKELPYGMPLCSFDDLSISGAQIAELLSWDPKKVMINDGEVNLFLCFATSMAKRFFRNRLINVYQSGSDIPDLRDLFRPDDTKFLDSLDRSNDHGVLFWTWYKVPDNVSEIFTGTGFPPLIRSERFLPPYKSLSKI